MRRRVRSVRPPFLLENYSGWDTDDLARFFARGLRAFGARGRRHIIVVAAPARSRGCAEIGELRRQRMVEGEAIVIAMAPPHRFTVKRLARLFEHEVAHTRGQDHEAMDERVLWSLGGVPEWAKGIPLRYRGRAPRQM